MIRPYEPRDEAALWERKRAFELGLASGTGGEEKAVAYADKLDEDYRRSYFEWVDRCLAEDGRSVQVAETDDEVVGYVFVLPGSLSHVWDAAVLNEIYVDDAHRGGALADALMEAALAYARDQDLPLDRMILDVDRANERARSFYERWGFEHWGEMVARDL